MLTLILALSHAATPDSPLTSPDIAETEESAQGIQGITPWARASFFTHHACMDTQGDMPNITVTRPYPTENGHYYATRIVPAAEPFHVTEVMYYLFNQTTGQGWGCDATLAHDVVLFKGDLTSAPPATPVELQRTTISQSMTGAIGALVVDVDPPIVLHSGETLWVAVEMLSGPTMGSPGTCPVLCPGYAAEAATDVFWSTGTAAPYPWQPMSSFGQTSAAPVVMTGRFPLN